MAQEPIASRYPFSSKLLFAGFVGTMLVLATFVLAPLVVDANRVPGSFPDLWVTLWSAKWCLGYLDGVNQTLFFAPTIFYPQGSSLLLHNLSEGIFLPLALIVPAITPAGLYRLAVLISILLNMGSAYLLARRVSNSAAVGLWLAFVWGVHPFFLAHIGGGHLNQLSYFTLPLSLYLVLRIAEKNTRGPQLEHLLLMFTVAWGAFLDYYQLFLLGILLGVSAIALAIPKRAGFLRVIGGVAVPALVGVLVATPKLLPAIELMESARYSANHDPAKHGADPLTFILPGETQRLGALPFVRRALGEVSPNWAEGGNYLGWSFVVFLIATIARIPRRERLVVNFCVCAGVFVALASLGPVVRLGNGAKFSSPFYEILVGPMPFTFPVPARLVILVILSLLIAVCVASRHASRKILVICIVLSLFEFAPRTLGTMVVDRNAPALAPFHQMKPDRSIAYVIDLDTPERAMFHQMLHEHPLMGGFLARRPRRGERLARNNPVVTYLEGGSDDGVLEWVAAHPGGVVAVPANREYERARAESSAIFRPAWSSSAVATYRLAWRLDPASDPPSGTKK